MGRALHTSEQHRTRRPRILGRVTRPSDRSLFAGAAILSVVLALPIVGAAQAQERSSPLGGRLPLAVGNWWVLGSSGGERLELRVTDERSTAEGLRVLRLDDSNGDYRWIALAEDGSIALVELHRLGQAPLAFEPPLPLIPPDARAGSRHEHESALRSFDPSGDSEPQQGTARARTELGRPESVRAPAGQFADCLSVKIVLELARGGAAHVEDVGMWLAPSVGPVRWSAGGDGRGATDLRLLEARVGDRSWPPER